MTYRFFVNQFIHPLIIYVLIGTCISYLLVCLIARFPAYRDSRSRAIIFGIPFIIPLLAYILFRPFMISGCLLFIKPFGYINDILCNAGTALATIFTPLFFVVVVFAVAKAGLSIYASRKIKRKYGFSSADDCPRLFSLLKNLCSLGNIRVPGIIVTKDGFARSFTMGYRKPVIVLSEGLINALDDEELETVVAHELGHIVRADSLLTWLTVFLRDLMFFTPLVFWIFRDLTAEKEKASDDYAINLTGKPMAFAQALIKVWRLSPRTFFDNILLDNYMPQPNFVGHSGILEHRVKRILDNEHRVQNKSWLAYTAVLIVAGLSISALYLFC